ncbi:MICOS complex subunit MIC19-like isoform X2 [Sinocyclocheilus grahami]|uniref:MICOS complex subunit MIC19-like n=1 Tax=Sinocyclocheilus grahami TaxID=75366 RepID=A0A672NHG7_SINGR|nr:PREDICTED: MICOS complex subunit MIC19-like isoform X2 [Sinocyclocheilus grahami]
MGANNSTRRVSFESDENENITVVKGIRLSEKVIDRMREPSGPPRPPTRTPPAPPPVVDPLPALVPISPPPDPVTSLPPSSLPERVKLPEQVTTTAPPPPLAEPVIFPPPPPESVGAVSAPAGESIAPPAATAELITASPTVEIIADYVASPPAIELFTPPPPPIPTHPITKTTSEPISAPPVEITTPSPPAELVAAFASAAETIPQPPLSVEKPVASSPPPPPAVHESELRRKIAEELQKGLEEERRKAREELNQRLEKEKSQAHVQAQAEAQAQVKDEVSRILALEKEQSIQKAILRERITADDERLQTQIYARQLEERDKELRKQDAFYREQVAKLKERSAQFYKVTDENYHKAADEVNAKFKRYEISPVCTDLQGQILNCYRENAGKTLLCSNIASRYMQCVNSAKQDKLRTGG